jgi:hypothetical protein
MLPWQLWQHLNGNKNESDWPAIVGLTKGALDAVRVIVLGSRMSAMSQAVVQEYAMSVLF